jgi:hypothetical protein
MEKEIYLIASYTPTLEKQDILRNLVNKLVQNNKKICLISHNHISQDIIERVNYYFYDEENKLDLDPRFRWSHLNKTPKYEIESRLIFPCKSSFFPVLRLTWFGYKICKFLGYEVVHKIEYDTKIKNFIELDNNTQLLKKYDCVLYSNKKNPKDYNIQGSYIAINLNSIRDDMFIYNEYSLRNEFHGYNLKVENFSFDKYYSKLNFIQKPISELENSLELDLITNETSPGVYFTLLYNESLNPNEHWYWYAYSSHPHTLPPIYRNFDLIINNKLQNLQVSRWVFGGIDKNINLHNIKFIYDNKIIQSFDMNDPKIIKELKYYGTIKKI